MQRNDLIRCGESIFRILETREDEILIINCVRKSMPKWVNRNELSGCDSCTEESFCLMTNVILPDMDDLSPADRRIAHERYTLIAGILPFVRDDKRRCEVIARISEDRQVSKQTIRNYLCLYLVYYLKLKENYFDDDVIMVLESMPDGILYSNLLLKLYLKSLKHGGKLQLDENIPYTAQMIATITHHQIGTVERALNIFLKLGLMERVPDDSFYMSNIELFIGQSSTEGERKKQARLALRTQRGQLSGHLSDTRPPEIEIKKEIEPESERETEAGLLHFLGRFRNVLLSDEDILILQRELPGSWSEYIERLSEYMKSSGKSYQSHLATILRWAKEDAQKKLRAAQRNYSVREEDVV